MNNRYDFSLSPFTNEICKKLRHLDVGEVIPYSELRQIHPEFRRYLYGAFRKLKKEGMVFGNIRNKGYKRLDDSEIVSEGKRGIKSIRRKSLRASKILSCADYDSLSAEDKAQHNAALSIYGAIGLFTKPSKVKRLSEHVKSAQDSLNLDETLALFKS